MRCVTVSVFDDLENKQSMFLYIIRAYKYMYKIQKIFEWVFILDHQHKNDEHKIRKSGVLVK